ncbi:MAG: HEAT repeat domain-containing protein [Candidatus Coatesbacteria bacterium]|nr:HEAT repeat domain-containing protein [Candidatus Coatesbacteria bacterium]
MILKIISLFILSLSLPSTDEPTHLAELLIKANIVVVAEVTGGNAEEKKVKVIKILKGKIMNMNLHIQRKGKSKEAKHDPNEELFFEAKPKEKWLLFLSWYYGIILAQPSPASYPIKDKAGNDRVDLLSKMLPVLQSRQKQEKITNIKKLLNSNEKSEEQAAIELLGSLDINQYFEFFIELMGHQKQSIRDRTANYLQEMRSVDLNKKLYNTLEHSNNEELNKIIIEILINKKSKNLPRYVMKYLKSPDPRLKELALISIKEASYSQALPDILLMVADENSNVRKEALETMKALGLTKLSTVEREKISDTLLYALQSDDENIRVQAMRAYPQIIKDPYKLRYFYNLVENKLKSKNPREREQALITINEAEYLSIINTFQMTLIYILDKDNNVRKAASRLGLFTFSNIIVSLMILLFMQFIFFFVAYLAEKRKRFKLLFNTTLNKFLWGLITGVGFAIIICFFHNKIDLKINLVHILLYFPLVTGLAFSFLNLVPTILARETGIPQYHQTFIFGVAFFFVMMFFINIGLRLSLVFFGLPFIMWFPFRPYPFRKKKTRYIIAFFLGFIPFIFAGIFVALSCAFLSVIMMEVFENNRKATIEP